MKWHNVEVCWAFVLTAGIMLPVKPADSGKESVSVSNQVATLPPAVV